MPWVFLGEQNGVRFISESQVDHSLDRRFIKRVYRVQKVQAIMGGYHGKVEFVVLSGGWTEDTKSEWKGL